MDRALIINGKEYRVVSFHLSRLLFECVATHVDTSLEDDTETWLLAADRAREIAQEHIDDINYNGYDRDDYNDWKLAHQLKRVTKDVMIRAYYYE